MHNHYKEPGGEDRVFAEEAALLEGRGHFVVRYAVHNDAVDRMNRLALTSATVWNRAQYRKLRALFTAVHPEVVHVHNTLPLISPAVYYAARRSGAAVVQTLHNYRMMCPSAVLFRDGRPCELCIGKPIPWPGVLHGCYRGDRAATGAVATMLVFHRALATYGRKVDRYIALTHFAKKKFVEGGLPGERIDVKPNFVQRPSSRAPTGRPYALFVGRLTEDKGLRVVLEAWRGIGSRLPLRVIGDGSLSSEVAVAAATGGGIEHLGPLPPSRVRQEMQAATVVIVPSILYETFALVVVEAFASGTPVLASRHGALAEIVDAGRTGLHFEPGAPRDLARAVHWILEHPRQVAAMGRDARREYEERYTPEVNYEQLLAVYERALGRRGRP